jgi:hypothetical protein
MTKTGCAFVSRSDRIKSPVLEEQDRLRIERHLIDDNRISWFRDLVNKCFGSFCF